MIMYKIYKILMQWLAIMFLLFNKVECLSSKIGNPVNTNIQTG